MTTSNEARRRRTLNNNGNNAGPPRTINSTSVYDGLNEKPESSRFNNSLSRSSEYDIGLVHWIFIILISLASIKGVLYLHGWVPQPLPPSTQLQSHIHQFSEIRARSFLDRMAALGPKPAASHELEVLAANMIIEEISSIRNAARREHRIELDTHRPTGCYNLDKNPFDGYTLCYNKVLNLVVRLSASSRPVSDHALLVNCHFDTWPDAPGASDDAVSCAVMLEMLRVITLKAETFPHDIIFLFNGAEENIMMASHGFITQHPWRHQIRAFVNLEAAGSGGREMLFQAGPGNRWILNTYLQAAPRPHCSIMGQEVFESGIVPGDTDFRIFRDFGHLSGLDLAYIRNGYVYHTEFDVPSFINNGTVQRAGENAMATIIALARSDALAHPSDHNEGRSVFIDLLGMFVIVYPYEMGQIMNGICIAYVVVRVLYMTAQAYLHRHALTKNTYYTMGEFVRALVLQYVANIAMLLAVLACSALIIQIDAALFWYAHPHLLLLVYVWPALIMAVAIHTLARRAFPEKMSARLMEQCTFDAGLVANAITLLALTAWGFASAFFWMFTTTAPFSRILLQTVYKAITGRVERGVCRVVLHVTCALPAFWMVIYMTVIVIDLFVPIMGRSLTVNSEIPISILCYLGALGFMLLFSSTVYVTEMKSIKRMLLGSLLMLMFVYTLLALKLIGTPYEFDIDQPRVKRMHVQHVSRVSYNYDQSINNSDTALIYLPLDHRGVADLPPETGLNQCESVKCIAEQGMYCNLPYYVAVSKIIPPNHFCWKVVPDELNINLKAEFKLISRESLEDGRLINLTFDVQGSDHSSVQLTPQQGWRLAKWSFQVPVMHHIETSFLSLAYGQQSTKLVNGHNETYSPWTFWILMQRLDSESTMSVSESNPSVFVSVSAHYVHGPRQRSARLTQLKQLIHEQRAAQAHDWRWAITLSSWNIEHISGMF